MKPTSLAQKEPPLRYKATRRVLQEWCPWILQRQCDNTRIIIQKNIDFGNYSIKFPVNEKSENIIVFFYFMV
ncbi:hypothetical protein EUGRSUZ_A02552 [Eucalyptus grandis]|uniref:Uncharacterized protein n=2 Tax=Eucalyptus grandis TaxID=71139 RepID=A0ACC3M8T3_EUCGR|nr:hypothetical protein EUGRSUZ_A02552 [Eucalyptus grandis]